MVAKEAYFLILKTNYINKIGYTTGGHLAVLHSQLQFPFCTLNKHKWHTFFRLRVRAIWSLPGVQLIFYIVNFMVCQSSYLIPISTMVFHSTATVMTIHSEQRVMTPSKMTWLLCWCKFFDDNTVDDFVSFVERSSVDVKKTPVQFKCCWKGCWHNSQEDDMLASFLLWTFLLQIPLQERGDTTKLIFSAGSFSSLHLLVSKNGFPHFLKSILMYLYFVIIFNESFQASLSATSFF